MRKALSAAITGVVLTTSSTLTALPARAETLLSQSCPTVSGSFRRGTDNQIINLVQNGCTISGNAPSSSFEHALRAQWSGSYFDYTVMRRNIQNGCTTRMQGWLFKINDSQIRTQIYGTDGRCDLPPSFTEDSTWTMVSNSPSPNSPSIAPRETSIAPRETSSEVVGERYEDMGGGWGGAKATLYRNGLLVIEGRAVSNAKNSGTRTTVNVVGVDRRGNALFVSQHLDVPTACGRWDPTCPSDRSGRSDQQINPEIAKYVSRLNIHLSDRQGPTVYQNFVRNIREACSSYDNLPVAVRAAIAYETGFPGCNPGQ